MSEVVYQSRTQAVDHAIGFHLLKAFDSDTIMPESVPKNYRNFLENENKLYWGVEGDVREILQYVGGEVQGRLNLPALVLYRPVGAMESDYKEKFRNSKVVVSQESTRYFQASFFPIKLEYTLSVIGHDRYAVEEIHLNLQHYFRKNPKFYVPYLIEDTEQELEARIENVEAMTFTDSSASRLEDRVFAVQTDIGIESQTAQGVSCAPINTQRIDFLEIGFLCNRQ